MFNKSTSDGTKDEKSTNADSLHICQRSSKPNVIGSARVETKPLKTKPQFYACCLQPLQDIAKEMGYNLVVHGSMNRDFDLVAIAWVDNPNPEIEVVKAFDIYLRGTSYAEGSEERGYLFSVLPGGRKNYVINLNRGGRWNDYTDEQYYLDISFTPQFQKSDSADR